jgi:hypothetical protein
VFVEVISRIGQPPIRLDASQVVVYLDNGTPISVVALYGDNQTVKMAQVAPTGEHEFNKVLRDLRINRTVICDRVSCTPPPEGAKLLAGPRGRKPHF